MSAAVEPTQPTDEARLAAWRAAIHTWPELTADGRYNRDERMAMKNRLGDALDAGLHAAYPAMAEQAAADALREREEQPVVGYVQRARWNEWEAVCEEPRCGWHASRGNKSREDAEEQLRGHAALVHPPRIPVHRRARAGGGDHAE